MNKKYLKFYYDNIIGLLSKESLQLIYTHDLPAPAAFNIKNRILYIKMLDEDDSNVDLTIALIIHEIGHALFTNPTENQMNKMPMNIIFNIIEDGYIERMICKIYPGLKQHLYFLFKEYFLNVEDKKPSNKITQICNVLNYNCKGIKYNHILKYPDFVLDEDVEFLKNVEMLHDKSYSVRYNVHLEVQKLLKKYAEDEEKNTSKNKQNNSQDGIQQETEDKISDNTQNENDQQETQNDSENHITESIIDSCDVSDFLDDSFIDHHEESNIYEASDIDKNKNVKSYTEYEIIPIKKYFMNTKNSHIHKVFDKLWNNSKINSLPFINKFNILKNADDYVKTSHQYKGTVDPLKIYTHRWSDNIFVKNIIQHNQTNHHFIIALDWSASMSPNIDKLFEQVCDIINFCDVCDISLEVVFFTTCNTGDKCRILQICDTRNDSSFNLRYNMCELFKSESILKTYLLKQCSIDGKINMRMFDNVKKILALNTTSVSNHIDFREYTTLNGTSILSTTLWCHERLMLSTSQRKSIILLTDGDDVNIDSFNFRGIQYTNNKDKMFVNTCTQRVNYFFKEEYNHNILCIGYAQGSSYEIINHNISHSFENYVMIHDIKKLDKTIIDKIIKTII